MSAAIAHNLARVRERVAHALERAGDPERRVTVVVVTKTFGPEVVREVIRAGVDDIGENRVQELVAKAAQVDLPCRWHLVGTLQRNKAAKAVGLVHMIHSIDGVRIAQTVDRLAAERGVRVPVLLEVNASGEATKHGVEPDGAEAVAIAIAGLEHVDLRGLMTIGPASGGDEGARSCFRRLAALSRRLSERTGRPLEELSMGMSDDFEVALEEGATIVRLGRVILGERMPPA
jgi:pyridoxal phosphate enzyme (YggS family)